MFEDLMRRIICFFRSLSVPSIVESWIIQHAFNFIKVKRKAKIRNRYKQVSHLTWDTIWESDKTQITQHARESRRHPFPSK